MLWPKIKGAKNYVILKNGIEILRTTKISIPIDKTSCAAYQVIAVDEKGYKSFANEPLAVTVKKEVSNY